MTYRPEYSHLDRISREEFYNTFSWLWTPTLQKVLPTSFSQFDHFLTYDDHEDFLNIFELCVTMLASLIDDAIQYDGLLSKLKPFTIELEFLQYFMSHELSKVVGLFEMIPRMVLQFENDCSSSHAVAIRNVLSARTVLIKDPFLSSYLAFNIGYLLSSSWETYRSVEAEDSKLLSKVDEIIEAIVVSKSGSWLADPQPVHEMMLTLKSDLDGEIDEGTVSALMNGTSFVEEYALLLNTINVQAQNALFITNLFTSKLNDEYGFF